MTRKKSNRNRRPRRTGNRGRPPFLPRSFREWILIALIFSTLAFALILAVFLFSNFDSYMALRSALMIIYINFLLFANNIVTIAGYKKLRRQRKIASKKAVFTFLMIYQWGLQAAGLYLTILFFLNKPFVP